MSNERETPQAPGWRISDADRDRVTKRLSAGLADGRLTPQEFTARTATAMSAGTTVLVLPPDASADVDGVELIASPARVHGVPASPSLDTHFVVRGRQVASRLVVRRQRRLWRWRW